MQKRPRKYAIRAFLRGGERVMAMIRLATCLACLLAIWGCLALWYRAPGGRALKILAVAVWAGFSLLALPGLSGPHAALAACSFAAAFGASLAQMGGLLLVVAALTLTLLRPSSTTGKG